MDQLRIKIAGMTYTLRANEDETYMRAIAHQADQLIEQVMSSNPKLNRAAAPVLALLNVLDQQEKTLRDCQETLELRADMLQTLRQLDEERSSLREDLWELKKDLLYYRNLCEMYEERLADLPAPKTKRRSVKPKNEQEREQISLLEV